MSELRFPKINTIVLSARLTKDPEARVVGNNQTSTAKLSVAFDRSYQKNGEWQQETSYIDVITWTAVANKCSEQLHKGSPIIVEGYLQIRRYQDKENNNRISPEIVANRVSFLEKEYVRSEEETLKKDDVNNYQPPTSPQPENNIDDSEIPF